MPTRCRCCRSPSGYHDRPLIILESGYGICLDCYFDDSIGWHLEDDPPADWLSSDSEYVPTDSEFDSDLPPVSPVEPPPPAQPTSSGLEPEPEPLPENKPDDEDGAEPKEPPQKKPKVSDPDTVLILADSESDPELIAFDRMLRGTASEDPGSSARRRLEDTLAMFEPPQRRRGDWTSLEDLIIIGVPLSNTC